MTNSNWKNRFTKAVVVESKEAYKALSITCWVRDFVTWFKRVVLRQSKFTVPNRCIDCKGPKNCKAFK